MVDLRWSLATQSCNVTIADLHYNPAIKSYDVVQQCRSCNVTMVDLPPLCKGRWLGLAPLTVGTTPIMHNLTILMMLLMMKMTNYMMFLQDKMSCILPMICEILRRFAMSFPQWPNEMAHFTKNIKVDLRLAAASGAVNSLQLVQKKRSRAIGAEERRFELWVWTSVDVWKCCSFV